MIIPANKTPWMEAWFHGYARRYLQRSFHTVYKLGEAIPAVQDERLPLLVCLNHSSWWDVLLAFYAGREWLPGDNYGVMDADQLERYKIFTRLGMIGVDRASLAGIREFLNYTETLLKGRQRALWLTPQGELTSNHARPIRFQPGLGNLAARLGDFNITTIALHYEFWKERQPEAFISFSPLRRINAAGPGFNRKSFVTEQEQHLETQLTDLLALVELRNPSVFQPVLRGKSGISPTYDTLRSLGARLRGRRFDAEHGSVVTPPWKERR